MVEQLYGIDYKRKQWLQSLSFKCAGGKASREPQGHFKLRRPLEGSISRVCFFGGTATLE